MTEIKKRNYTYDAVRGFCMFLIVLQHFTFKGGYEFTDKTGDFIYVGIDIFVMQVFFFLSGMFSKHPERNRDKLFKSLLWPVIVVGIFFWAALIWYLGFDQSMVYFRKGMVPYAMWFLVVLFVFRYFQVYYCKVKHLLLIAFFMYLFSGIFEPLSSHGFALSRMFTFFISFVMGYLMTMEQVEKISHLKIWQTLFLGAVLIAVTYLTVYLLPENVYDAVKLESSYRRTGLSIAAGLLIRSCQLVISSGWIILLFNIFSSKKGFWAHIGMNTMPVYIFHLFFSGVFLLNGFTFGIYDFSEHEGIYLITLFALSIFFTFVLSTKPFQKAYSVLMDSTYLLIKNKVNEYAAKLEHRNTQA